MRLPWRRDRLRKEDVIMLCEHVLALMREVTIAQAVRMWDPTSASFVLKNVKRRLVSMLDMGIPFAQSLMKVVGNVLSPLEILAIRVGEANGNLDIGLTEIIQNYKIRKELMAQTKKSLVVPGITFAAGIIALIIGIYVIIPRYEKIFMSFIDPANLPPLTKAIMETARWIRTNTVLILLGLAGLGFVVWKSYGDLMPGFIRRVFWRYGCYMMFLNLYILLKVGIPFQEAVKLIERSIPVGTSIKEFYRLKIILKRIYQAIVGGMTPNIAFKKFGNDIGKIPLLYVDIAISTGTYEDSLIRAAEYLKKQYISDINVAVQFIQPLSLFITGCVVAVLLFALWIPLFQLAGSVG